MQITRKHTSSSSVFCVGSCGSL